MTNVTKLSERRGGMTDKPVENRLRLAAVAETGDEFLFHLLKVAAACDPLEFRRIASLSIAKIASYVAAELGPTPRSMCSPPPPARSMRKTGSDWPHWPVNDGGPASAGPFFVPSARKGCA